MQRTHVSVHCALTVQLLWCALLFVLLVAALSQLQSRWLANEMQCMVLLVAPAAAGHVCGVSRLWWMLQRTSLLIHQSSWRPVRDTPLQESAHGCARKQPPLLRRAHCWLAAQVAGPAYCTDIQLQLL